MTIPLADRRRHGAFYTPPTVARRMVRQTLGRWLAKRTVAQVEELRLLDLACGDGVFLREAYRWLLRWRCRQGPLSQEQRRRILTRHFFGVDRDGEAVEKAVARLTAAAGLSCSEGAARDLRKNNLIRADALLDELDELGAATRRDNPGFDIILGNPPYVGARRASLSDAAYRSRLSQQFKTAQGAYDLYVLFLERATAMLRDEGLGGMIVPNKLGSQDYASNCRARLARDTTLLQIDDLSHLSIFRGARVYPWVVTWRKAKPARHHRVKIARPPSLDLLSRQCVTTRCRQSDLVQGDTWTIEPAVDLSRAPTRPLGELAAIHCGAAGFEASRLADRLFEQDESKGEGLPFVVSGNIDRFRISTGDVRFMKRRWRQPAISANDATLSPARRRLYREPKIVVAGLTRRLEAAFDKEGIALGVQVYAISQPETCFYYLLGLLNSKLMSHIYSTRHGGKRLSGGYLAINKGPLATLPIFAIDGANARHRQLQKRIADAAESLSEMTEADEARTATLLDDEIDNLVLELYAISDEDASRIQRAAESWSSRSQE